MDFSRGMNVHLAYFVGTSLVYLLITFAFQALVTLIKATLLEAIILWQLNWGSFTRSLRIAFLVNLVTQYWGSPSQLLIYTGNNLMNHFSPSRASFFGVYSSPLKEVCFL
jgi:hypothetical protein